MNTLELKIPPVLLVFIFVVDMLILKWLFPRLEFSFSGQSILMYTFAAAGVILPILGLFQFYKHKTTVDPMHPEAASQIVQTGIYKYTRNPMYLGFLFLLCAVAVYLGNLASLIMLPLFVWYMNRFQIIPEERILKEKFGSAYYDYTNNVRRWL